MTFCIGFLSIHLFPIELKWNVLDRIVECISKYSGYFENTQLLGMATSAITEIYSLYHFVYFTGYFFFQNGFMKFLGKCNDLDHQVWVCLKKEVSHDRNLHFYLSTQFFLCFKICLVIMCEGNANL